MQKNSNIDSEFIQLDVVEEKKVVGGIAFTSIVTSLLALIFGIPMLDKMLSSDEGKLKLPLGITGEWNGTTDTVEREVIHSQSISPTFYN